MKAKTYVAAMAALGTLILAASPAVHAGNDDDRMQRSDRSPLLLPDKPKSDMRSGTPRYEGTSLTTARESAQSEWLMRQLQISDGYAPVFDTPGPKDAVADGARPADSGDRAQAEWLTRQLPITDGYAPARGAQDGKSTVVFAPEGAEPIARERAQSEWLMRQLQVTDGYAPTPVARAKDGTKTLTSAYQGVGTAQE